MSADSLLQFLTQALFVLIFLVVAARAVRERRRAVVDTALLFGVASLLVMETWVGEWLHVTPNAALSGILAMALPFLLVRLVDDFTAVPRSVMAFATIGLLASALSLAIVPARVHLVWLTLLYVAYFVILTVYASVAFILAARRSSGVTGRRMQAVAAGSLCLGLTILVAGLQAGLPAAAGLWMVLARLFGLGSGLGYFIGFAPPDWLRRAWQEPEVRAFLGRAASLPRLPDTPSIVRELEFGARTSLGAPYASIMLWDEATEALHGEVDGKPYMTPVIDTISGRAFATQRALFSSNAVRDDPAHADLYQAYGAAAVIAVPITAGSKRLGVLSVYGPRASIFAEDDLVLAQLLADQAAVILESRALIDEATRVRAREEATRLKDDFLSAAAHDLKTPLTSLIGQAQLMERRAQRNPSTPADLEGMQQIVRDAQRLKRLVLDLLDVARVEQGKLVGKREPVEIVALAREACARHSSARHRCLLDADAPVTGNFDTGRIMQLLDNLLENAVKYSPDGGNICVALRRDADEAYLTVSDNGIGILPADLPQLFDRFHRGTNVDDRRFSGMGLGLFICRGIVEQHGGRLWASSSGPNQGSTFHVALPLCVDERDGDARDDGAVGAAEPAGVVASESAP